MAYYSRITPAQQTLLQAHIIQKLPAQISALQSLIRIPSVKAPASVGNAPFGAPMRQALDEALAHARALGFAGRDLNGYAGVVEYGEGKEALGILAHLDVVPAGEGWAFPPFGGEVRGGRIYGRGAADDKGPAISALYALAAVAAAGIPLRRRVQIILGCDEESGWACMDRYKKTEPLPALAFTPDADYPLVYSEKTILHATYTLKQECSPLRISCGERANVVPGAAEAIIPGEYTALPAIAGFEIHCHAQHGETRIRVEGRGAHAAMPEEGRNALQALLTALDSLGLSDPGGMVIHSLTQALGMDMHGESLGVDTTDPSGRLTLNPGILHWDADQVQISFDSRVPLSQPPEQVLGALSGALSGAGFVLTEKSITPGHSMPRDSELVQTLLGVYRAQSGDLAAEPLAIGGGTYARALPNAVAFGCRWPGTPDLAHVADEYVEIDEMQKNTHMMADAIIALARRA